MNPLQLIQAYCNDEKRAWKKNLSAERNPCCWRRTCCNEEEPRKRITFLLNKSPAAEEELVAMKRRESRKKSFRWTKPLQLKKSLLQWRREPRKNLSAEQIPCSWWVACFNEKKRASKKNLSPEWIPCSWLKLIAMTRSEPGRKPFCWTKPLLLKKDLLQWRRGPRRRKTFLLNKFPAALNRSPAADE